MSAPSSHAIAVKAASDVGDAGGGDESEWGRAAAWIPTSARIGWMVIGSAAESMAENLKASVAPWLSQLSRIRDAAYALPPMPWAVWVFGALLASALICGRWVWGVGLVRSSRPAPGSLRREVARLGRRLGLRRWPIVRITDRAISPMVVCAPRCTILLPTPLWRELDDVARQAVILHELAHLKRRDHWVLLIESVVSTLYWWNPVAWWVRRRLRDEAELCCDAWVTCLMPKDRRAYAEVLLTTRRMVQSQEASMPTVGMTMTSGRASRMARRIKMIMTERARPRLSVPGCALGLALACGAWMTAPAAVCPPDECKAIAATASAAPSAGGKIGAATPAPMVTYVSTPQASNQVTYVATPLGSDPVTCVTTTSAPTTVVYSSTPQAQNALTAIATATPDGRVMVTTPGGASTLKAEKVILSPTGQPTAYAVTGPQAGSPWPMAKALIGTTGATPAPPAPPAITQLRRGLAQPGPIVAMQNAAPTPMPSRRAEGATGDPLNDRIRRLEEQMQRLERQLAELNAVLGQREKTTHDFVSQLLSTKEQEQAANAVNLRELVEHASEQVKHTADAQAHAEAVAREMTERAVAQARDAATAAQYNDAFAKAEKFAAQAARTQQPAPSSAPTTRFAPPGVEVIRSYPLPAGKLESLMKLMLRDDVPVRVRQDGDKIEVHGTEQQHAVFAAFIALIGEREELTRDYRLPEGKLKALSDLMVREDVPIMVNPGADALTVHGTAADQAIFQAFIDLIHPRGPQVRDSANLAPAPTQPRQPQPRGMGGGRAGLDVIVPGGAATAGSGGGGGGVTIYSTEGDSDDEAAEPTLDPINPANAQRSEIEARLRDLQTKAREIEREAKSRERKAADLERQADLLSDQADDLKGDAQKEAQERAREMERQANDMERAAEELHAEAEKIQGEVESLQEQVLAAREQSRISRDRPRAAR